mmetsp:Transcript_11158/g.25852  ORF Transcript_11158/g.25852 Transcript_11158/m.25852 type:complete len:264 (+) Transcript_11158:169-960(+)
MKPVCMQVLLVILACARLGDAFIPGSLPGKRIQTTHQKQFAMVDPSHAEVVQQLRDSAAQLRKEAEELEAQLIQKDRRRNATRPMTTAPPSYTTLKNSTWTLTYRFASDAAPSEEEKKKKTRSKDPPSRRDVYSGRLTLTFRPDGYTDVLEHEATGTNPLTFTKVWGWDPETSDNGELLLFSSTAKLPETDATNPNKAIRFYWEARVDEHPNTGALSLVEGSVTIKKDIEVGGGLFGIFDTGGILAEFREVGYFVSRPSRPVP